MLRNMPERGKISHHLDENYSWLGRVAAVLEAWNRVKGRYIQLSIAKIHGTDGWKMDEGINEILTSLHQARHSLRMQTVGRSMSLLIRVLSSTTSMGSEK